MGALSILKLQNWIHPSHSGYNYLHKRKLVLIVVTFKVVQFIHIVTRGKNQANEQTNKRASIYNNSTVIIIRAYIPNAEVFI